MRRFGGKTVPMPKWSRLAKIFIIGAVALGVAVAWFSGNLFYSLFWALLEEWHVPVKEADVIAYTLAHLIPFAAVLFISAVFYFVVRRELASASSSAGKALPDVSAADAVHRADKLELEGLRQRLLEWKEVPEAIEAFAESSILKARDKWKAQFEEACEKAPDAEDQIRNIKNKFPNGHVPDDTPEGGALATARERLVALAMSHDLGEAELRLARDELRGDIHKKLSGGELIAKGFHIASITEIEIPAAAWRILLLDNTKSEATRKDGGGSIYTGLMISKALVR
jgi:hypothetical protein